MSTLLLPTKVALLAVGAYVFTYPDDAMEYARVGASDVQANVLRLLVSLVAYSSALIFSDRFRLVMILLSMQVIFWALCLYPYQVLSIDSIDLDTEKDVWQLGATASFVLLGALVLFSSSADELEEKKKTRERLIHFYSKHNPSKLDRVDGLLKKYEGNEELLFSRLHEKYNNLSFKTPAATEEVAGEEEEHAFFSNANSTRESPEETPEPLTSPDEPPLSDVESSPTGEDEYEVVESSEAVGSSQFLNTMTSEKRPRRASEDSGASEPSASAPTRTNSSAIRDAIAEAKRAQEERIQQRIAELRARPT